ncbi:hypothetical protein FisN_3Hh398 [Fistulifera solaris]|jgi:hypothetical protein|uniref:Uncharacterized protein n=1 Tax=Fistulifera solaris TaxID=1519565 RepID=A0A1Z5JQR6_FISSO|nr:hypothetical protein FisN_3Hh398 [Fistulifera solaris]|eukprot:GAX16121.1 hypothetical protein FisN_3Hh398 [Fistulifera solaris]
MRFQVGGIICAIVSSRVVHGWLPPTDTRTIHAVSLFAKQDDDEDKQIPFFFNLGDTPSENRKKLGIDLGSMLEPLTEQEANELKAAAAEVINDAIAEGIDEIETLRARMNAEFAKKRETMAVQSELNAKRESTKLLEKIDTLTAAFLKETESQRQSTKLAAAADRSMEGGRGLDWGAWGTIRGATVGLSSSSLIGSVDQAQQEEKNRMSAASEKDSPVATDRSQQRVLILADTSSDPYAKRLVPDLTDSLKKMLPGLNVDVYKPTATMPIGADNAACVVVFCTSWSDKSALYNAFDRLLRKTLQPNGSLGSPPSQLIAVSTVGTERTNKMPYTMQNMMGAKLDKRRQIEEAIINTVRNRVVEPAMDYTVCKFGELKESKDAFAFEPGDVVDGSTDPDTAITILTQAIGYQPAARNATLSCVGKLPVTRNEEELNDLLDDFFLKLDGPELWRQELAETEVTKNYASLVEYIREWAELLAESGKGLTTPIRAVPVVDPISKSGIQHSQGVQLLFLPTSTGKNYVSREEEKQRGTEKSSTAPRRTQTKEGGIQVMVEITRENKLRVRAKRCNYADDTVIKEISEETILKRLRDGVDVWVKDHKTT